MTRIADRSRAAAFAMAAFVLVVAACGRSEPPRTHALYRALFDGGRVALVAPTGPLLDVARDAQQRFAAADFDVTVVAAGEREPAGAARLVAFEVHDPRAAEIRAALGIALVEAEGDDARGFRFMERDFRGAADSLRAVLPDPGRPGLPLVAVLGNDAARMARDPALFELGWRPSFTCRRAGEIELRGEFSVTRGGLVARDVEDLRGSRARDEYARMPIVRGNLLLAVPPGFDAERVRDFSVRAWGALGLAHEWLVAAGMSAPEQPLVAHVHVDGASMSASTGRADFAFADAAGERVHVLLSEWIPDDAGAALVTAELERALGAPAEPWIARAAGLLASGSYLGRPLEEWHGRLAAAGLAPDAARLLGGFDPSTSPHLVDPLRAALLGTALEGRGPDALVALWRGRDTVRADAALEAAWRERCDAVALALSPTPQRLDALARRPHLSGVRCELGTIVTSWLDPLARDGTARAAATGAQSALVGLLAWPPPAWTDPRLPIGPRSTTSDVEVFAAIAAMRRAGLVAMFAPEYLESAHADLMGNSVRTTVREWEEFFEQYERFLVHYGLLAELAGAHVFVIGSDLGMSTRRIVDGRGPPELGEVRGRGWTRLIEAARAATSAALTYAAGSDEVSWIGFWPELDFVSVLAFAPLVPPGGSAPNARDLVGAIVSQFHTVMAIADGARRPALVLGAGFPATDAAWARPWMRVGRTDPRSQERYHAALVDAWRAVREPGILRGVLVWSWTVDGSTISPRDASVRGRPAERLLPLLFGEP